MVNMMMMIMKKILIIWSELYKDIECLKFELNMTEKSDLEPHVKQLNLQNFIIFHNNYSGFIKY